MVEKFAVGDLVQVVDSVTSGFVQGEIGLVTSVEIMRSSHYIYWVLFGKEKKDVPMWDVEIRKIS